MSENTYTNDEQTENSTDTDDDADTGQEQEQDAVEDAQNTEDVDRFGGTGLSTSDLTELTPFDAEALSGMGDEQVAYLAEKTAQNHSTDGSREAYVDAITATLAQVTPDHEWSDPAALREHAAEKGGLDELKRMAQLIENSHGVSVVEHAEGNAGPASDGTLANHRERIRANAGAGASAGGDGANGGGDFGLDPSSWREEDETDGEGPVTTGTMADYRKRKQGVQANAAADDGAPRSLRVNQRTVQHGEDAYYAEVARRKRNGRWDHPEPNGYFEYRKRMEAKNRDGVGPEDV